VSHRPDDTRQLTPIVADEPVEVRNPRRQLRRILVLYALLPLVAAAMGAWIATNIAYQRAAEHTDKRFTALERDLTERRKAAAEANARRDAQQAQTAALVCLVLDHLQPRDEAVEAARARYNCPDEPATPGETPPPDSGGSSGGVHPTPSRYRLSPQPTPGPPTPTGPPGRKPNRHLLGCVDLPLIPKICI
jgi:hypothetical protein